MSGVVHGGLQEAEMRALGLAAREMIDLSANLHPAGPDPAVIEAARGAALDRYPPPDAAPLREAIAAHHGVDPTTVLVTPGATAAIHLATRVLMKAGETAALFTPTFGEYRAAIELAGGHIVEHAAEAPDFAVNLAAVAPAALAVLCHPNNPTGACVERPDVERLIARLAGGTLVLDLAYEPFLEAPLAIQPLIDAGAPLLALHSMTKLHAIPGLRLGYAVGAPALIARLGAAQPAWSVDAPAIAAGLVAIEQVEARRARLTEMRETREEMRAGCRSLGCAVAPGRANFLLIETGDARAVRSALLRRGYAARDCASFGLPDWIRVAVPSPDVAARFLDALRDVLGEVRS